MYSRVAVFADCDQIEPPAELQLLCVTTPVDQRTLSNDYIWHVTPLMNLPGVDSSPIVPAEMFTAARNGPARSFAIEAIKAQPRAYLSTGWSDFLRTFALQRQPYPNPSVLMAYEFSYSPTLLSPDRVYVRGATIAADLQTYQPDLVQRQVEPFAGALIDYQRWGTLPGPGYAVLLILAAAGLLRRDPRRWQLLLLVSSGLALLLVPPYSAEFDYRYTLPALPVLGPAAALATALLLRSGAESWASRTRFKTNRGAAPEREQVSA